MKGFLAAIRFLTVFPVPGSLGTREENLARSVVYFPFVGLLAGFLVGGAALILTLFLPPLPSAVIIVLLMAGVSGGLHLDGLSDTADGLLSSRGRERSLEIMRDSRIGSMGAVALTGVILLKVAALGSMPLEDIARAAFLMPLAGRTALVVLMGLLPYARSDGGLGTVFYQKRPRYAVITAIAVFVFAAWFIAGRAGVLSVGLTLMVILVFGGYVRGKLGGATGDTLGAGCEIAETVPAITLCFLF